MTGQPYPQIPDTLDDLMVLAQDLFWTWSHTGDALWARLEPALWRRLRNPWTILATISPERLETLGRDEAFLAEMHRLAEERRHYLDHPGWFRSHPGCDVLGGVAFFSLEFGLSEALPLYAGGLGVLSGDFLKTASDLDVPVCGVGLLYQAGYFRQILDAAGRQEEAYPYNEPGSMPIRPARDQIGGWLRIPLDLPGRTVLLRVWEAVVGRTRLYLLDSNDPMNTAFDRGITAKLYGGGPNLRFLQEVALGIGGWRALEALGREPDVCHMNEGHTAFAALERIRSTMKRHALAFRQALWACRAGNVFTTHTPVEAGFDRFAPELVRHYLLGDEGLFADVAIGADDLLALGRRSPHDQNEPFNTAYLAMRLSARVNGVSRLHGTVSRRLFADLFPRWPDDEVPVGHVTNGIHMPTWDSAAADALWTETCGKERWRVADTGLCEDVCGASDEALWAMRAAQRKALVDVVRRVLARQLPMRNPRFGAHLDVEGILDPNALTLGFGRRFTAYKRPGLLLTDPDRLARLLSNPQAPTQLVIAGKAHPDDKAGKRLIEQWMAFARQPALQRRVVFLEDYDFGLAAELVQGVDVWINTPMRPLEACGTSGMKVLVNGGLNLSSLDGWWDEAFAPEVGWAFGGDTPDDPQDAADLYGVLEQEVVPEFYARDERGVPRRWIERIRASMSRLGARYCSNRMLRDYVDDLYVPAAAAVKRRLEEQGLMGRALAEWEHLMRAHWDQVHFSRFEATQTAEGWDFVAHAQLGGILADQVAVEMVAEEVDGAAATREAMERGRAIPGAVNGYEYRLCVATARPAKHYTPRVRPAHPDAVLPAELPLVHWHH
jgi:starch phosphorylase